MQATINHIRQQLTPRFGRGETEAIIRLIFRYLKGWNTVDMLVNNDKQLSDFTKEKVRQIVARLLDGEPIQYITGDAYFYGMDLKVTPDVLIPRPETAELVDLVVDNASGKPDLRVLDIGTGSGCIAIALARNLPFSRIQAIDISPRAIDVARDNASMLKAKIDFSVADIFSLQPACSSFDIIVSNPPYIVPSERGDMDNNVLLHEPWSALFVPEDDPLRFYIRIADFAITALAPGGRLYFELNPIFAEKCLHLVEGLGFSSCSLLRDSAGLFRFLSCIRP